jgi:hypothetical protein
MSLNLNDVPLHRATGLAIVLAAMAAMSSQEAQAQSAPNLVGTWKGQAQAVFLGANPYRKTEHKGPNFSKDVREFTFVIKEQHDNRFSGESTEGKRKEQLIGAISTDNRTGIVLDDDGQYLITIRDLDTIDSCYSHHNAKSKVVACYAWKRQK